MPPPFIFARCSLSFVQLSFLSLTLFNNNKNNRYFNMEAYEKTITYAERALAADGDHEKSQIRRAMALYHLNRDLEKARDTFLRIAKRDTKNKTVREYLEKVKSKIKSSSDKADQDFKGVFSK